MNDPVIQKVMAAVLGVTLAMGGYFVAQNDKRVTNVESKIDKVNEDINSTKERLIKIEKDVDYLKEQNSAQLRGIDKIIDKLESHPHDPR